MEPEIDSAIEIINETPLYVAVAKSGNCPVHEGGKYKENCLTSILEKKYGKRFFPVYRLDRETSGIVIFAKQALNVKSIFDSITCKEYLAVCQGNITEEINIDKPIGEVKGEHIKWKKAVIDSGKNAITKILPVENYSGFCLVKAIPKTGRQHQIRVHLSHVGHPIIGDKIYGGSDKNFKDYLDGNKGEFSVISRQALHLGRVKISSKWLVSEIPEDMRQIIPQHKIENI